MTTAFELRDVRVEGDGGPIISAYSATIPAEGVTAIVGPSGSGKTTLLRLLNRLDDPDEGEIRYRGRDVRTYDVLDLRRRVQLVAQVPVTFPGTVADNVTAAAPGADVAKLLARVGLDGALAGREADRLSVGEAQRMALARALAVEPECLLLDEPTSALDGASRAGVETLVRTLADEGHTMVIVTHDPRQASELADRQVTVPAWEAR